MKQAFVGVALPDELVTMLPERADVASFLRRRAVRMGGVCFWAVIDHSIAVSILDELEAGNSQNAFMLLQTFAVELGPIISLPEMSRNCHENDRQSPAQSA